MIVPRSRLLFWVGMVFLPFTMLANAVPGTALLSGGIAAGLLLVCFMDALLGRDRLRGIKVELPEVVRLSKGREGEMILRIHNDKMTVKQLRLGLAFPHGVFSPSRDMIAQLPEGSSFSTLTWPLRGLRKGLYLLDKCYLEVKSPLGLWAVRRACSTRAEVHIYPNLYNERKHLTSLFLNRGIGIHAQRQVGKGRDFEQLREYFPGDSYEDIHWKATAKWGRAITKVYQIERTQELYVILDASRLSGRSTSEARQDLSPEPSPLTNTILERFITASLIMNLVAERQGDLFGILTFDDRVRGFLRAKSGKAHYNACRDALYTLDPQPVTPDFSELFTYIGTHIRRRALLIFLTNLDDPVLAESFVHSVNLASRRHLVLVNMLRPEGARPLFSSPSVTSAEDLYRNLAGHLLWSRLQETAKVLKRRGVDFSLLSDEKLCAQLVSQYLGVKQRQAL